MRQPLGNFCTKTVKSVRHNFATKKISLSIESATDCTTIAVKIAQLVTEQIARYNRLFKRPYISLINCCR